MKSYLILEQGRVFEGEGLGAATETVCELVFHTAMTGYTELLTDPAYAGQVLVLTYPLIGNAGVCGDDFQSAAVQATGLVASELSEIYSNFRGEESLQAVLERFSIPGLTGIDIRSLVRLLRADTRRRCMITRNHARVERLEDTLALLRDWSPPDPSAYPREAAVYHPEGRKTVALPDTGVRRDLIMALCERGLRVQTYLPDTEAERILADKPDGILLAGGPGDPSRYQKTIRTVKALYESDRPLMAFCLGHQLLALATGAKTRRLPGGHQGGNIPVRNLETGRVLITAQNHDYTVEEESLDLSLCRVSHRNVNDGTVEGLYYPRRDILTLQYVPNTKGTAEEREIIDRFVAGLEAR